MDKSAGANVDTHTNSYRLSNHIYTDVEEKCAPRENRVGGILVPFEEIVQLYNREHPTSCQLQRHPALWPFIIVKVQEWLEKKQLIEGVYITDWGSEGVTPAGCMVVTQVAHFPEGYKGMPDNLIPKFEAGVKEEKTCEALKKLGITDLRGFTTTIMGRDSNLTNMRDSGTTAGSPRAGPAAESIS